jgi:hypothetical protein
MSFYLNFNFVLHKKDLYRSNYVQLVAKKTGKKNFPNVNLVLCICQLIV